MKVFERDSLLIRDFYNNFCKPVDTLHTFIIQYVPSAYILYL